MIFKDTEYGKVFMKDFHSNMISIDSMMSILKLTNKKKFDKESDLVSLKEAVEECVQSYPYCPWSA